MTPSSSKPRYVSAVGLLLVLVTLWWLWSLVAALAWLLTPGHPVTSLRTGIDLVIALCLLSAATAYLREASLLWQIPLQAAALALIVSGVPRGIDDVQAFVERRGASVADFALSVGCVVAGLLLGLWMKNLQDHYLGGERRHGRSKRPEGRVAERGSDPLRSMAGELRAGTWAANARIRSSRRKSPWNLLLVLILPLWLLLFFLGIRASRGVSVLITHGHPLADHLIWPSSIAPALVYFPLLLGAIVPAMVLVNYFVYFCVPPARRAMDAEDKAFPGVEYSAQQPLLVRIAVLTAPAAFLLAVIGQLFL